MEILIGGLVIARIKYRVYESLDELLAATALSLINKKIKEEATASFRSFLRPDGTPNSRARTNFYKSADKDLKNQAIKAKESDYDTEEDSIILKWLTKDVYIPRLKKPIL